MHQDRPTCLKCWGLHRSDQCNLPDYADNKPDKDAVIFALIKYVKNSNEPVNVILNEYTRPRNVNERGLVRDQTRYGKLINDLNFTLEVFVGHGYEYKDSPWANQTMEGRKILFKSVSILGWLYGGKEFDLRRFFQFADYIRNNNYDRTIDVVLLVVNYF